MTLAALVVAALPLAPARAQAPQAGLYNQVDVTAETSREVPNDLVNAMLYVELTDSSASAISAQLTKTTNDALRIAQQEKAVRTRTGTVSTVPVFASGAPGRITAWRGRSEIRLEGRDLHAVGDLIGKLQSTMSVGYVNFAVSPEVRRQTENELIGLAIEGFRARAELVRQALGGKGVRIRHMAVNAGMAGGPPRAFAAMRASSVAPVAEPPQLEAGVSQVQVSVAGTVEIE
jgi:predicted secreted protein